MGLPTKSKTWNWTSNQRSTFVSVQQVSKDILFGYKVAIAAMLGAVIKGSSIGATTSMDGVDRWTSASVIGNTVTSRATATCSWIVFTLSGFGGADLLIALVGSGGANQCLMLLSPAGSFTVSSTVCPAAPDEVSFSAGNPAGATFHSSTASGDRLWSIGTASDSSGIFMLVARAGVENFFCSIQMISSSVISPATFSPALVIFSNTSGAAFPAGTGGINSFFNSAGAASYNGAAKVNGGSGATIITALFGAESYSTGPSAISRLTFAPELQGGGNLLSEISVWSETAPARGKLGYLVDCWLGFVSAVTADTYPNDTSRQFIQWNIWALPWDGSTPVLT